MGRLGESLAEIWLLDPASGPFSVVVDEGELRAADDVDPFNEVAFHLSHEFAMNAAALARQDGGGRSSRDEGVLRGLTVRSIKLLDRLVDETIEEHGEMESVIGTQVAPSGRRLARLRIPANAPERLLPVRALVTQLAATAQTRRSVPWSW